MSNLFDMNLKKLGFGFMRLPSNENGIDMAQINKMVDSFMEKGYSYFDTAFGYHGGESQIYINKAVVSRYPRESFQIATKLPSGVPENAEDVQRVFDIAINKLGTDYIDFYLLHGIGPNNAKVFEDLKAWEFVLQKKKEGKVKHLGFSFHGSAKLLDEVLTKHPEAEFVQLQINYMDWESNNIQSKLCYEVACKHNKPIIIMEPVKGGTLARLQGNAQKVLEGYNKDASPASWAMRYCASLDNIFMILSGMSTMEQMDDNLKTMENFEKISKDEMQCLDKVVEIIESTPTVPCTDCKYCVEGCPMEINIPLMFTFINDHKKFDPSDDVVSSLQKFKNNTKNGGKPSTCIACGACENICPQHIKIINELKDVAKVFEK